MRIALITREFPPDTLWGGEAIGYYDLATGLVGIGHEVHVICQALDGARSYIENDVYVHRVGGYVKQWSPFSRIDYGIRAFMKIQHVIRKHGIDIVDGNFHGTDTFLYSLYKVKPLVAEVHGSLRHGIDTKRQRGLLQSLQLKMLAMMSDFTVRRADSVITISPVAYHEVTEEIRGVNKNKVRLIYHARNIDRYYPVQSQIKETLDLPDDGGFILIVGRLEHRKGTHILCEAIPQIYAEIPNIKIVFVGKDMGDAPGGSSYKDYALSLAKHHNIPDNTIIYDSVSHDNLLELYTASDCVVCPSLHEVASSIPLEAMACGKPVIASNTGIASSLPLDFPNGAIIPVGDVDSLAAAIIKFLKTFKSMPHVKANVARNNRRIAEKRCSIRRLAIEVSDVYKEIIDERLSTGHA